MFNFYIKKLITDVLFIWGGDGKACDNFSFQTIILIVFPSEMKMAHRPFFGNLGIGMTG